MIIQQRRTCRFRRILKKPLAIFIAVFAILFLFLCLFFRIFNATLLPIVKSVGIEKAKAIASISVMWTVEAELNESGVEYADLVTVETSDGGKVRALI